MTAELRALETQMLQQLARDYSSTMPAFSNTRSVVIKAAPEEVHALVDDFHQWLAWSPWEHLDPELRRSYTGPSHGVGAHYEWSGNRKAGTGSMEITHSSPERIVVSLQFIKPFKARNTTEFRFTQRGATTLIDWTMRGERNLVMHGLGKLFFDKAIGKDFERGLASLKKHAES